MIIYSINLLIYIKDSSLYKENIFDIYSNKVKKKIHVINENMSCPDRI
jgi:hypothetical protein